MLAASLGCGGGGGNSTTPDLNPSISDLLAGIYDVTLTVTAGTTCSDAGAVGSTVNDTITVTTSETDDSVEIFSEAGSTTFTGTRSGNNFDVSSTETTALSPVCSRQVLTEISGNQTDGNLTGTSTVT
ncbi:MAG: hypothetical protein HY609_04535, partial [Deltaproteobacteria bacterium]|nr:hypothetical protein [Deltaproteobacteria bacterium]